MINTLTEQQFTTQEQNIFHTLVETFESRVKKTWFVFQPVAVKISDMAIGIIPIIFVLVAFTLESLYPAYSRIQNTISELVWGPHGWGLSVLFFIFGFALMALAIRLCSVAGGSISLKLGISFLFLMGLGFIIIAIFPTRAPGAGQSIKALIHLQTARGISIAFPLSCLLIGIGLRNNNDWQFIRLFTLTAGGFGLLFIIAGALATFTSAAWIGAIERVILMNGLIWMEVIGIQLLFPQLRIHLIVKQNKEYSLSIPVTYERLRVAVVSISNSNKMNYQVIKRKVS